MRILAVITLAAALVGLSEKVPAQVPLPDTAAAVMPTRAANEPTAVVELFTSQGCSSCPSADALLARLAGRDDVIALSLPVDYWDYLGWKDTLASPRFSERQRAYAHTRADGAIYTPQAVVNGLMHVNGADEGSIKRTIEKTGKTLDATKPAGEWNHLRVVISPDGSLHEMNGVKYVEYVIGSEDFNARVADGYGSAFNSTSGGTGVLGIRGTLK